MAVRPLTRDVNAMSGVDYILWETMTTNDTGQPLEAAKHSDKTIQVVGNFGTGDVYVNRSSADTDATSIARCSSTITVMEVRA